MYSAKCVYSSDAMIFVNNQLNVSQQCAQVAKKTSSILACIRNDVACRTREMMYFPLYLYFVRLHLKYCVEFCASSL